MQAVTKRHVMHEEEVELQKLIGRSYKLIVGTGALPCKAMNGGVSFFPARAHAPGHVHEAEEEVIYCLEGHGEIVVAGKAELIQPGCFMVIPPGLLHSVNNTGDETIKLIYLFSPPCKIGKYADIASRGTCNPSVVMADCHSRPDPPATLERSDCGQVGNPENQSWIPAFAGMTALKFTTYPHN